VGGDKYVGGAGGRGKRGLTKKEGHLASGPVESEKLRDAAWSDREQTEGKETGNAM